MGVMICLNQGGLHSLSASSSYSLGKGHYRFSSIGLFICLFICKQHYLKSHEWIALKFYGEVRSGKRNN